jgi:hypothetical protein
MSNEVDEGEGIERHIGKGELIMKKDRKESKK